MLNHSGPAITRQTRPSPRARTWGWEKKFFFRNLEFSFSGGRQGGVAPVCEKDVEQFRTFFASNLCSASSSSIPSMSFFVPPTGRFWRILDHDLFFFSLQVLSWRTLWTNQARFSNSLKLCLKTLFQGYQTSGRVWKPSASLSWTNLCPPSPPSTSPPKYTAVSTSGKKYLFQKLILKSFKHSSRQAWSSTILQTY